MNRRRIRGYSYVAIAVFTVKGTVTLALLVLQLQVARALLSRLSGLPPTLVGPIAATSTSLVAALAALWIFRKMRRTGGRCPVHSDVVMRADAR